MDFDRDEDSPITDYVNLVPTVALPSHFIFVKHHAHANKPNEIIPLDQVQSLAPLSNDGSHLAPLRDARPWAPFKTYADYKFTSRCVRRRTPNAEIAEDLHDQHAHAFSSDCFITFRNHRDMEKSLAVARISNIPFRRKTLKIDFEGAEFGGVYEVEIEFRDPWEIMKQWVTDESLAPVSTWFSQEKYLCEDGTINLSNRLYDEPCTGRTWGHIDDSLPTEDYPCCYLGLHIWLDKGLVSTKVKMHPILFRGCWIHSATRNGSGNGGSALAGFVKMPDSLRQIDPNTLTGLTRSEYDRLKRLIYRGVCHLVMASLERRSHNGEALRFGDGVTRVAYPGVLIESMDFEELAAWLAIRNSTSLHPCPQCLVHKNDFPRLTKVFPEHTTESMSRTLTRAPAGKTDRNEQLKQYGLHDFEHFLWKFNNSDPFQATSYDCLHFFDGGIWGRHMCPLIKGYLQNNGLASKFNANMANFPRWRDLKHISSPTTIDYSDDQTFLDILKCALPCIVQLLPANSCLVQLIRIMNKTRVLLGLEVATDTRLDRLRKFIADYEKICKDVSETHNKSLIFLKQHFLSHAIACFKDKGTSRNQNTRVGEGFQQEIAAHVNLRQMSIMDENEETMARLDMKVKEWQKSQEEDEADPVLPSHTATDYWRLGSADARISSIRIETLNRGNPLYRDFNMRLREYLAGHHPKHPIHEDQNIQIEPCKVLYVEFQSKVDWNSGRDILRCNPKFHGRPRYDSVIYEAHDDDLAMGQLELVFRCHLPHKVTLDLALIQPYRKSSWAPRTRTDYPIREWSPGSLFITMEHITRGALLCPIFGAPREVFYVMDCVDEDMFLPVNEIE
ncbi:hypothetical protein B0H10DRAFT_1922835 [Mycena sp. CBHHK59/15]|nr:hypothetical protein B0H10DRAFT_1821151 [Mycena sp. CBHHK59/15]KAJ6605006.1 hypothetical protein B0H10DRAFT_1922835 [Mycena sp. CBHHK59/15]